MGQSLLHSKVPNTEDAVLNPVIKAPAGVYVNNDNESVTIETLPNCAEVTVPVKDSDKATGELIEEDGLVVLRMKPVAVRFTSVVLAIS